MGIKSINRPPIDNDTLEEDLNLDLSVVRQKPKSSAAPRLAAAATTLLIILTIGYIGSGMIEAIITPSKAAMVSPDAIYSEVLIDNSGADEPQYGVSIHHASGSISYVMKPSLSEAESFSREVNAIIYAKNHFK